ncbi:MAG: hypothetical protein ABSE51_02675 [Terracidiphilus sp.]|jgi:hypothetical protein
MKAMFGFGTKLPVTEEERLWVDEGFGRLSRMLGSSRLQNATVVLPTDEFFPDPWDASEAALKALFRRVCGYMGVSPSKVELAIDTDTAVIPTTNALTEMEPDYSIGMNPGPVELALSPDSVIERDSNELVEMLPVYSQSGMRNESASRYICGNGEERPIVAVNSSLLNDTLTLVATLAHELGYVVLLDGGHLQRDTKDLGPLADLVTVYLGLGVFTANASGNFRKYQGGGRRGWSMSRLGYLPETVFGYALARFAKERGEEQPAWTKYLSTNLKAWFRQSAEWIRQDSPRTDFSQTGIYRR